MNGGKRAWHLRLLVLMLVVVIVAAGCSSDDDTNELVIGADQEPDCVAWILSCSGSSWGYWMMNVTTMPRAFDTVATADGGWEVVHNPHLLAGEPTLDDTNPEQPVITYAIHPDAVWSDDTPITCADFEFTWQAIANGSDVYDPTGYLDIASIDCPDPKTVVMTLAQPYVGWKQLFGAGYGVHPAHLLEGKDLEEEMANGYDWSGGPWIIDRWEKGNEVVLVPNERWPFGTPRLDRVVFKIQSSTASQFRAFRNREVDLLYPTPQPDVLEQVAGISGAEIESTANTGSLEALWINNEAFPLDDIAVRQAFAHAIDRDALVERLFGAIGVTEPMHTMNPPLMSEFADTEAFARYNRDLGRVDELMAGAGWAKDADGVWAKDGRRAEIVLKTTAGDALRELTVQIVQEHLNQAGFAVELDFQDPGALFGEQLGPGDFQVALFAQGLTFISPWQCALLCSANVPTEENEFSGLNATRTVIPELDAVAAEMDQTFDDARLAELAREADRIMAEHVVSLPLDPLPTVLLWRDSVDGPVSDNPVLGPFWNLHELGVSA